MPRFSAVLAYLTLASPLASVTAVAPLAHADSSAAVTITFNAQGEQLARDLGFDVEGFRQRARDRIAGALQLSEVQRFLRSFANATSFSNRGIGADYASNSERLIVGVASNLAVSADLGDDSGNEVPTVGVAANVTLMAGLNLRRWKRPELTVYANVFHRSADSGQLRGAITNVGLHGQYKFFTPTIGLKRLLVQWGGVDVTAGLELARWSLGLRGELTSDFEIEAEQPGTSSTVTAALRGRFDVGSTTVSAPIEVTTNLRLLYIASLYLGLGLDLQAGHATIGAATSGTLSATRPDVVPGAGMVETIGEVSVAAEGSNRPSIAGYHLLLGAQINLWRLKVFTQASVQPSNELNLAVALGLRLVL
jgi:hypothetical protein